MMQSIAEHVSCERKYFIIRACFYFALSVNRYQRVYLDYQNTMSKLLFPPLLCSLNVYTHKYESRKS